MRRRCPSCARQAEKTSKLERAQCDEGPCSEWDADERPNCVMQCQSEACYASTFAGNELEPGEVDVVRGRQYQSCLTRERSERLRAEGRRARSGR